MAHSLLPDRPRLLGFHKLARWLEKRNPAEVNPGSILCRELCTEWDASIIEVCVCVSVSEITGSMSEVHLLTATFTLRLSVSMCTTGGIRSISGR